MAESCGFPHHLLGCKCLELTEEEKEEMANQRGKVRQLTAELATANEVISQIAQMFGVTDTRHILGDLGRVQAGIAVMRTALERIGSATIEMRDSQLAWERQFETEGITVGDMASVRRSQASGEFWEAIEAVNAVLSHEAVAGEVEGPEPRCECGRSGYTWNGDPQRMPRFCSDCGKKIGWVEAGEVEGQKDDPIRKSAEGNR